MRKLRLKRWAKVVLVILILVGLLTALKKLDDSFMKDCTEAGYSTTYCENGR